MNIHPLRFIRRGQQVTLHHVPPMRTLLELLREDLNLKGTKEGCGEGDCGACTVVLGQVVQDAAGVERIEYRAINSCIKLAHAIDGMALWTVEDLAGPDGSLHPVQQSLLEHHASQCGFCTPGFAMSLFGMYQNHVQQGQTITRELAQCELSGNLCRCTGYRPILEAAQHMGELPVAAVDEAVLLQKLKLLTRDEQRLHANLMTESKPDSAYLLPTSLAELLALRSACPQAQIVAGSTDVGLWVTKQHRRFEQVLDLSRVQELRRIETYPHHIAIGAAVTLTQAFTALLAERPELKNFASRFAGLPVRNAGTLGGNVANGSPIGDSMPLLIALGTNVVLMSVRGHRELPLEQLYTGYRTNVMAADEVLAWIKVPRPEPLPEPVSAIVGKPTRLLRAYKISKRYDDDISAVCLVLQLTLDDGRVSQIRIGAGGVAATPARAVQTEAALCGQPWTQATVRQAMVVLRQEFQPISDMRATGAYRSAVMGNLLQRFWLESQGVGPVNLEACGLEGVFP